jgi:hypothetical protein
LIRADGSTSTDRHVFSHLYEVACKRYRRLLPENVEKERAREKRRVRADGAKNPPPAKKKRFDACGRWNCIARLAQLSNGQGVRVRAECMCGQPGYTAPVIPEGVSEDVRIALLGSN